MYPRVDEFMSSPVVVVRPDESLAHARRLMLRYRVGRLVVVDDALRPIGVLTRSDIARVAASPRSSRSLDAIRVEEAMTRDPVTIRLGRSIREAARLMLQHGVSGLPVVDESGRVVGVITKTDVVRAYAERLRGKYRAQDVMYRDPPTASPQHSIYYVAELLDSHPSRRVLIVDGGRLVGIVAPSDIAFLAEPPAARGREGKRIRRFEELPKGRLGPVYYYTVPVAADIMTPDPVTVGPDEDLAAVASLMIRGGFSSVPVVVDEEPVGIVVKHSILRAVVEKG
ncbi:MAG: CBS domain-containing protein [Crenarchaeota archaeon]|nr:CBS domain-containing protein [Thermoproteota archaeon]